MNNIENIGQTITSTLVDALNQVIGFLPELVAGLVILLVGWAVASLLRTGTQKGLHAVDAPKWFGEAGVKDRNQQNTWVYILGQLVFWATMFVFLIPVFETWNLTEMTNVLNLLFLYLPRVFAAIVIGFLGYILANLTSNVVENATDEYGDQMSRVLTATAKYSILIFTSLIVLNQLGIASELVQIFFSAVMFGSALAVGLAFGLGGKEPARNLLESIGQSAKEKVSEVKTRRTRRRR